MTALYVLTEMSQMTEFKRIKTQWTIAFLIAVYKCIDFVILILPDLVYYRNYKFV